VSSAKRRMGDCLVLSLWCPAPIASQKKLPVLVRISRRRLSDRGASVPFNEGSAFAREGLVLVSFNYRLGRMGFFGHPALPHPELDRSRTTPSWTS